MVLAFDAYTDDLSTHVTLVIDVFVSAFTEYFFAVIAEMVIVCIRAYYLNRIIGRNTRYNTLHYIARSERYG